MKTLDYWDGRLTTIPSSIDCVEMRILAGDQPQPVFTGPGHIDIRSTTDIDFTMYATPSDDSDPIRRLTQARENPYEMLHQFVLDATDYKGTKWNCGWIQSELKEMPNIGWPLTGKINSLVTRAKGPWVSKQSSVELVFRPKLHLPMDKAMITVTSIDGLEIERKHSAGQQTIQLLDSEVKFFYTPSNDSLWLIAKTSEKLPHPYLENWVSEPLRILLGQLVYPRLVARNFGDGTAHVWLRRSLKQYSGLSGASLLGENPLRARNEFWELYKNLLRLIAEARDNDGHPNFEPHPITRFYEEINSATQGSKWILCMTLSSVAEGLLRLLIFPRKKIKIDNYMKALVNEDILIEDNQQSWTKVRHEVMHGHLVSPWGTKEEEKQLNNLVDLVRRLTRELIKRRVDIKPDPTRVSANSPPNTSGSLIELNRNRSHFEKCVHKENTMNGISQGNADELYTEQNNGWFVGYFVDEDPFRQTSNVEMKWKKHQPNDENKPFEANHSAKSMSILIKGSFLFQFQQGENYEEVLLKEQGDYVIWLPNVEHRGSAKETDTIMLTLRWPSLHGDHFDIK